MTPLVSICLPNLNMRPFLEERMETLLQQTFTDWEMIICDSYSTDGAWEFFQKFKGDPRIRLHQVPRDGMYAGWNECLRRARGRYLYMATSDHTCAPTLLERLLLPLERRPELKIAVCGLEIINEKGVAIPYLEKMVHFQFLGEWMHTPCIRKSETEFLLQVWFGTIWFSMTSVLFDRSVLDQVGFFRTDCASHADHEWSMRAALTSDIAFVPDRLATWRGGICTAVRSAKMAGGGSAMASRFASSTSAALTRSGRNAFQDPCRGPCRSRARTCCGCSISTGNVSWKAVTQRLAGCLTVMNASSTARRFATGRGGFTGTTRLRPRSLSRPSASCFATVWNDC